MKRFLLTMVAVMLVVTSFTGCLAEKSDEEKIRDTVNGFFDCYNGGDYEGMTKHLGRKQRQILEGTMSFVGELVDFDISSMMPMLFGVGAEMFEGDMLKFEISRIDIEGDTAEVYGDMKINMDIHDVSQETYTMIKLEKEGSDWKISYMEPRPHKESLT